MQMPGRQYNAVTGYRYGFNGKEKSDEIAGEGNSYTAEFWQYDSRIGRRWNLDPKPIAGISRYSTFANNPIWYSDIKGDTLNDPNNIVSNYETSVRNQITTINTLSRVAANDETRNLLTAYATNLNGVLTNINNLRTSTVVYDALIDNSANGPGTGGITRMNPANGHVEFAFATGSEASGAVGHEISHGIQYDNLQLSLRRDGQGGALADITDEIGAYTTQAGSELNMGSMINPPVVNEAFVRNFRFPDNSQPYLNFPAGPINGLGIDGRTATTQLQTLKADAVMNGFLSSPMNDYYRGWEVDNQIGEKFMKKFSNFLNRPQ